MKIKFLFSLPLMFPLLLIAQQDSIISVQLDAIFQRSLNNRDFDKAVQDAKNALDTVLTIGTSPYYPAFWKSRIGTAFLYKQENDSAIVYFKQAKEYFSKQKNAKTSVSLAVLCQTLGIAYSNKRDFKSSLDELSDAVGILKNSKNPRGKFVMCQVYSALTYALANAGKHDSLVNLSREAVFFIRSNLDSASTLIGNVRQNLGISFYLQGMYPEAETEFNAALAQYNLNYLNRKNSKSEIANILNNLGGMRFEKGDYEEALSLCARAIYFLDSLDFSYDAPEYLNAYGNIAQVLYHTGDTLKAKYYFLELIKRLKRKPDALASVFATAYDGLGQVYLALGKPDSARDIHLEGLLQVRERFKSDWHTAFMEFNIGKDYLLLKELDLAKAHLNAAIETYHKSGGGKPTMLAETYRTLAEVSISQLKWDEAIYLLKSASLSLSSLSDAAQVDYESRFWKAICLTEARLYLQKHKSRDRQPGDIDKAYELLHSADRWLSRYRNNLSAYNPEILHNIIEYTHLAEDILWEMYQFSPSQSIADEMFETADRGKSRMLFEQFRLFNALESQGLSSDSLKKLNAGINIWSGKIAAMTDTVFIENDWRFLYQSKLAEAKRRRDSLLLWLDAQDSVFAKKRRDPPGITRSEAQSLLSNDQCLLEYTVTDSLIYIFLLHKDSMHPPIALRRHENLREWTDTMLKICRVPPSYSAGEDEIRQSVALYIEAAHGLYNLLLDTVRPFLAKRVTVIRDSELNFLPFEALIEQDTGDFFDELPYMLHKFVFSYENTAALYREARHREIKPTRYTMLVAPFDDWSYANWGKLTKSSKPLPNQCSLKLPPCDIYPGEKATKNILTTEAQHYRFIHLPTHAKADDKTGKKSFILFRKPNSALHGSSPLDTLFAAEIFGLTFQAEIISLSACETSAGELKKSEGVVCLAWAFAGAGARSIVTTLWEAEADESAPFIINQFYGYLHKGKPRDEALSKAKADYLSQQSGYQRPHPFFWAPFILTGETEKVKF